MQLLLLLQGLTKSTLQISLNWEPSHLLHPICHQILSFLTPIFFKNCVLCSLLLSLPQFSFSLFLISTWETPSKSYFCSCFGHFKYSQHYHGTVSFQDEIIALLLCLTAISNAPVCEIQFQHHSSICTLTFDHIKLVIIFIKGIISDISASVPCCFLCL